MIARANQVVGSGIGACAALSGGYLTFVDNQCTRATGTPKAGATVAVPVVLVGAGITASHNVVSASAGLLNVPVSMDLTALGDSRYTVLGNHTTGAITIGGSKAIGDPWAPLNVRL